MTTSLGKSNIRSRGFFLSWNNPPENFNSLIHKLQPDEWAYQLERGNNNQTPHVQGHIYFKHQQFLHTVRRALGITATSGCEISKNPTKNLYGIKSETRVDGPWISEGWKKFIKKPLKDPIATHGPRPWQKQIIDMIAEEPDDRKVIWIYDENGRAGKTKLAKHLVITGKAHMIGGVAKDLKYAITELVHKGVNPECLILLLPRQHGPITYEGIEQAKDGCFFSEKFKSSQCIYNSPHILIFSNELPDITKLTEDRWEIYTVSQDSQLINYQYTSNDQ